MFNNFCKKDFSTIFVICLCLQTVNRVHFSKDASDGKPSNPKPGKLTKSLSFVLPYALKRSKSLSSADVLAAKAANVADASELGKLPLPVQEKLNKAIKGVVAKLKYQISRLSWLQY